MTAKERFLIAVGRKGSIGALCILGATKAENLEVLKTINVKTMTGVQ
ncbi:MAG TPA: hypothetical protein VFK37_09060 [Bacillales bacterium]|nr:hypothetical protein [Bacillales bacterium]